MIVVIPGFICGIYFLNTPKHIVEINDKYKITQVISSGYVITENNNKILLKSKNIFNIDDLINVRTTNIEDLRLKKDKYSNYLKSLNIKYIATNVKLFKIDRKTSIRAQFTNYLLKGPNFYVKYVSLILTGKRNDLNKDLYEKIKYISVLHLFVISGFHINLLMTIILFVFKKIKIKKIISQFMGFLIIFIYLYFLNFPLSSLRAFLFLILCFVNRELLNNKFNKIDILSLIMLIIFISNPFVIFSLSFIFTFLITFSILFVIDIKNKKIKILLIALISYLCSVILFIHINGWINILGLINSIIFSPIAAMNYVISIFGFPFKNYLNYYYMGIDYVINIFYKNSFIIKVDISWQFIYMYYLSFFLVLSIIKHYNILKNTNIQIRKSLSLIRL